VRVDGKSMAGAREDDAIAIVYGWMDAEVRVFTLTWSTVTQSWYSDVCKTTRQNEATRSCRCAVWPSWSLLSSHYLACREKNKFRASLRHSWQGWVVHIFDRTARRRSQRQEGR